MAGENAKDQNENSIADGVPMNPDQIREYLQGYFGIPIALRELGKEAVKCPYCLENHGHGPQTGHQEAGCGENGCGIVIGERYFIPSYGYTICEYELRDEINKLILPDNLLSRFN